MWLTAAGALVLGFAAVSWWLKALGKLRLGDWLGAAFLTACVAGTGIKLHLDQRAALREAASIAWPGTTSRGAERRDAPAVASSASPPATPDARDVAPVESLIGGLERRLEQTPDDANGWALLAQSYAFTGNGAAAEKAVTKAVALGFDERALRERVTTAQRGPHASGG
jgi:hypothetical protein